MPTAKVGDISIYYEVHGEGEALLLIMGYAANSGQWFRQIPGLSREYRVIAFDNRGTGRSDKPDIPYTMEMMAGDVAGLLEGAGHGYFLEVEEEANKAILDFLGRHSRSG